MAIYHFSVGTISRGAGQSAVSAAAYRSCSELTSEADGRTVDYTHKGGLVYSEIMTPDNAPDWMKDRAKLWNGVEARENRKDARTARTVDLSLPAELSKDEQIELAREFVKHEFVSRGMVADLNIHDKGDGNPHVHVMLTTREIEGEGLGKKNRDWDKKELLKEWRGAWADFANRALERAGHPERITADSYEKQGLPLEGQSVDNKPNTSVYAEQVERNNQIARDNGERIKQDPFIALQAITYTQSTFTDNDIKRFAKRQSADTAQMTEVYHAIKNDPHIMELAKDERGEMRYTTTEMFAVELSAKRNAMEIHERAGHGISEKTMKAIDVRLRAAGLELSDEQSRVLNYTLEDSDLRNVVGLPGTGKSRMLYGAREAFELEGFNVRGAALSGIAAQGLEGSSGIESQTIAKCIYQWDHGENLLTSKDVLVVDEAAMIGSRQTDRILKEANARGAKVIMIGDYRQLQAIEAGAPFRMITENTGKEELTEVRRQKNPEHKEATKAIAEGRGDAFLKTYEKEDRVHWTETTKQAKEKTVLLWNEKRQMEPDKTTRMLTYRRADVDDLNDLAREKRKENNELGKDHLIQTAQHGQKAFARGDEIVFERNNYKPELDVRNGTSATIKEIKGSEITAEINKETQRRTVTFNTTQYDHINHAYARTVHKEQGDTFNNSITLMTDGFDQQLSNVAGTRHTDTLEMVVPRDQIPDRKALVNTLNKERLKDVSLDYEQEPRKTITREAVPKTPEMEVQQHQKMSLDKSNGDQQEPPERKIERAPEPPSWEQQQLTKKAGRIEKDVENCEWMIEHKRMVNTNAKELERIATTAAKDKNLMKVIENKNPELSKKLEAIAHEVTERARALDRQGKTRDRGLDRDF